MNFRQEHFLNLRHLPGRLNAEEAAWLLGFSHHDIPVLVAAGLLKPLGQPVANAVKYFDLATVKELIQDSNWQSRASKAITGHWRMKNSRKKSLNALPVDFNDCTTKAGANT